MRYAIVVLALISTTLACERNPADPGSTPFRQATLVFRDVRVFDGHEAHDRTTVVVADDRIVAVAPDAAIPAEATVVEGAGRTLLPGLIDAHTHTGLTGESLEQALVFGITTELDMFDDPRAAAGSNRRPARTRRPPA